MKLPSLVIVGRPNVGKSTLFNRICGRRKALVGDEPGITRDRNYALAEWQGQTFEVIDTGGILPGQNETIPLRIFEQAKTAIRQAAAVLLVVDGRAGLLPVDAELAKLLIQSGKPVFVAVNKCDSAQREPLAHPFYELGLPSVAPVSAEHGHNVAELLDEVFKLFPRGTGPKPDAQKETRIAIIGKPNVGKSTLLNRLVGEERVIVSPIPGTTRDAIDFTVERDGKRYVFVDTAGIRKQSQIHLPAEQLSVIMARKNLERCDVALVVIDGREGITALDATIAGYAHEAGVSVVLVINKWDLVAKDTHTMHQYEQAIRDRVSYLDYAPIAFTIARNGARVAKLFPVIDRLATARYRRVTTSELNHFLQAAALEKASIPANKQVKVYYMTQIGVGPPRFALFTNSRTPIHFSLERYLVNQIRKQFDFVGTPILIKQKFKHG